MKKAALTLLMLATFSYLYCANFKDMIKVSKKHSMHGFSHHPLYSVWEGMVERCTNPNSVAFKYYGGDGINICEEWRNNAGTFVQWALDNNWIKGLTVERKDIKLDYSPDNCILIRQSYQALNTRRSIKIEMDGVIKNLREWARFYEINLATLRYRINVRKMSLPNALTEPYKRVNHFTQLTITKTQSKE